MPPPAAPAAQKPKTPLNVGSLTGAVKAAIWLLSTDEKSAIDAMALLSADEIVRLREGVTTMEKVGPDVLASIHAEFAKLLEDRPLRVKGSMTYLHQIANQALGEARAAQLLMPRDALPPSAMLMDADVELLAGLLSEEYPQVIAAVLATLKPQKACQVLLKFPDALRREVVGRVARLHKVPHASLARAQQVISNGLPMAAGEDYDIDGVRIAASLLNQLESEQADEILNNLGAETLSTQVRQAMFTFEDLARLDRRGLQTLLKEVSSDKLLLSLKAASDTVKGKIFEGLSKRAGEMMREDLQMMGPTKLADVEKAQTEIVTVALRLRTEGKLTVVGMGGDFV